MDSRLPPFARAADGKLVYLLGTDDQGRDMLSAILYGLRISIGVGVTATLCALALPPLLVVATVQVAAAIIANGFTYLLSGKYWISPFPGIALLVTIVSINPVGDQLRDVLNPRLQR